MRTPPNMYVLNQQFSISSVCHLLFTIKVYYEQYQDHIKMMTKFIQSNEKIR
jgi:hypothetical protein